MDGIGKFNKMVVLGNRHQVESSWRRRPKMERVWMERGKNQFSSFLGTEGGGCDGGGWKGAIAA